MKDIVITISAVTSIAEEKNEKAVAATLKDAVEKRMEERGLPQHRIEVTVILEQPYETVKAEEVPPF
jgi:hypothetical protein